MTNFVDDLSDFFDVSEFASAVVYAGNEISGHLENEYIEAGGEQGMESRAPVLTVRDSDIAGAVQGDGITVDSRPYRISEIQPDGTGLSDLILVKL